MAKANIPIYRDMVELLKLLMREVKNMPKADNRTVRNAFAKIRAFNARAGCKRYRRDNIDALVASVNSYLGIMRHHASRKIRKRLVESIDPQWLKMLDIDRENYHKVLPQKRYRQREIIRRRLR